MLYSDGVSEAMSSKEIEFGVNKLIEIVKSNLSLGSGELLERIKEEIKLHTRGAAQSDDITMVIVKKGS